MGLRYQLMTELTSHTSNLIIIIDYDKFCCVLLIIIECVHYQRNPLSKRREEICANTPLSIGVYVPAVFFSIVAFSKTANKRAVVLIRFNSNHNGGKNDRIGYN